MGSVIKYWRQIKNAKKPTNVVGKMQELVDGHQFSAVMERVEVFTLSIFCCFLFCLSDA